jgi:DNA-binding MarR family transcriptional regulator
MQPNIQFNQSLIYQIHSFIYTTDQLFELELIKQVQINYNEFVVLLALSDVPDSSQDEIALWCNFTKSTASKNIDKLVKKSLLKRVEHSKDRRQKQISFTKLGLEKLKLGQDIGQLIADKLFQPLTQDEYTTLYKLILKINHKKI